MTRTLSEHVAGLSPRGEPRGPAVPPPPPDDGDGRPPDEPVHPGMRLAVWVWALGFGLLSLQVVVETGVGLFRAIRQQP